MNHEAHPINIFKAEIGAIKAAMDAGRMPEIGVHFRKIEEILLPTLKRYKKAEGFFDLHKLYKRLRSEAKVFFSKEGYSERTNELSKDIASVFLREENELFPTCEECFTEEDWYLCYGDLALYGFSNGYIPPKWDIAEAYLAGLKKAYEEKYNEKKDEMIPLPGGELSLSQLTALIYALPMDITFVDENETNRFFMDKSGLFKRPLSVLNHSMLDCHPTEISSWVKSLTDQFKSKARRHLDMELEKPHGKVLVRYQALYDENDKYLGIVEIVRDKDAAPEAVDMDAVSTDDIERRSRY